MAYQPNQNPAGTNGPTPQPPAKPELLFGRWRPGQAHSSDWEFLRRAHLKGATDQPREHVAQEQGSCRVPDRRHSQQAMVLYCPDDENWQSAACPVSGSVWYHQAHDQRSDHQ